MQKLRGRLVRPNALPAAAGRPEEWGPWEWRSQYMDPRNRRVHAGAVDGIPFPPGARRGCLNAIYSVLFFKVATEWGEIDHLMVRRHDQGTMVPWADKQRIKDELVGTDRTAIEVYPARADLVDDAPIYHLWVLPPGFVLPFGLHRD